MNWRIGTLHGILWILIIARTVQPSAGNNDKNNKYDPEFIFTFLFISGNK
ncbi:MAG: hypothetical protein ACJ748_13740 [Flavisolibacter sp.]